MNLDNVYPEISFPPLPASCRNAMHKLNKLPENGLDLSTKEGKEIVLAAFASDSRTTKGIQSCISFYDKLRKIYKNKGKN